MLRFALVASFAIISTLPLPVSTAQARSCSQQGSSCKTWVKQNVPAAKQAEYNERCTAEIPACIDRCKSGNKFFIGVYRGAGGQQSYPIDACN